MLEIVRRMAEGYGHRYGLDGEDLRQEAYLAVATWARDHHDAEIGVAFLIRVARFGFHAYHRSCRRRDARFHPTDPAHLDWNAGERGAIDDDSEAVARAVEKLPFDARCVVRSSFFRHRSFAELANAWGVRKQTIMASWRDAERALRDGLDAEYGPLVDRRAARPRRKQSRQINRDWSTWGRIPNQREDD
jgi:DNA-directed RNA polymerase specialized sigma24 family protein